MGKAQATSEGRRGSACWLLKEEPTHYSFEDLVRDGETTWDGITNALALKHMRSARKGDRAIIYHTGDVKAAVGLARIASDPFPDPKAPKGEATRLTVVKVRADRALPRPVTLAEMRANPGLDGLVLLKISRLSFLPVSAAHWEEILRMAGADRSA